MSKLLVAIFAFLLSPWLLAQANFPDGHLDPTRNLPGEHQTHVQLPEQYLWTANDITAQRHDHNKFPWNRPQLRIDPHYFRATFNRATLPKAATLYIAGPRSARIWINGTLAATFASDIDAPIGFHVFHADISTLLHAGSNTIAVEAVRGRGIVAATNSLVTQQITYGEVLAAKIVPASFGLEEGSLLISTPAWKSTTILTSGWEQPRFDDSAWQNAATLGPIESNPDLMQWSADAGMYEWPGYMGMSPNLRTLALTPQAVTHVNQGLAHIESPDALTHDRPFTITDFTPQTDSESPAILVDFGREISGRLLVQSASSCESTISVAYGESEIEALATGLTPSPRGGNYLGTNLLHIAPNGVARGPKSAFRYVRMRFLRGCPTLTFISIHAEAVYYPVEYKGSFESSDPLLNRIWETGAYTVHLCMQDGIWDAPKRDRGLWVGDLDIEGRVISTAFGDSALIEDTLNRLAESTPPGQHVNAIPSYSSLWITSLESLYMHSGDKAFLISQHDHLLQILNAIDASLDAKGYFTNPKHQWLFVDWAPNLYAYTPDAVEGTNLQFLRAWKSAVTLLREIGDGVAADKYQAQLDRAVATRLKVFDSPYPDRFGPTWQINVLAELAFHPQLSAYFRESPNGGNPIFDTIKQDAPTDQSISPYFNAYLLDALSLTGRQQQALDWIKAYWGGMLAEGATSFWESYDLRWPKDNFHLSLQADGTSGYFVSLAHGWSSGPTAWLSENVLGIRPTAPGYKSVEIAPNLLTLSWAKGSVPTPLGPIAVAIDKTSGITLDLPSGIAATLTYNGKKTTYTQQGHYQLPAD